MKTINYLASIILLGVSTFMLSCDPEDPKAAIEEGAYVVCEGGFLTNTADISIIKDSTVITTAFEDANNIPLGDVAQSLTFIDNKGFIVVNNSQKIEVVDKKTFTSLFTIKDLSYPRYVCRKNAAEILVTNGNGLNTCYLYAINSTTGEKTDSVETGKGPERVIMVNNKIYVANTGGWDKDSTITVINATTFEVESTITIGHAPVDMVLDNNNNLVILCKGLTTYDAFYNPTIVSNTKIVTLNTSTNAISTLLNCDYQIATYATNVLETYNGITYFIHDGIYKLQNNSAVKLIDGSFNGFSINPANGDIWVCNAIKTIHSVTQYTNAGIKVKEVQTAQYPNSIVF